MKALIFYVTMAHPEGSSLYHATNEERQFDVEESQIERAKHGRGRKKTGKVKGDRMEQI